MTLAIDAAAGKMAALSTLRELIGAGLAGLDCYDEDIFVVDAPTGILDNAEVALDVLGASFRQVGPFGERAPRVECVLSRWVRGELGLDRPDAPRLVTPLASRGVRT